jgi:hypothetical protein
MTEPRKKLSEEELVRQILADDRDADDEAEIASMTKEELERELAAGGLDPEKVRRDAARDLARLKQRPMPRRRALTWSLLAAAALAAAAIPIVTSLTSGPEPVAAPRDKALHGVEIAHTGKQTGGGAVAPVLPYQADAGENRVRKP